MLEACWYILRTCHLKKRESKECVTYLAALPHFSSDRGWSLVKVPQSIYHLLNKLQHLRSNSCLLTYGMLKKWEITLVPNENTELILVKSHGTQQRYWKAPFSTSFHWYVGEIYKACILLFFGWIFWVQSNSNSIQWMLRSLGVSITTL